MTRFRTQLNRSVTILHPRKSPKYQHIFEYRPASFYAVNYCTDALCIKDGVKIDPACGSGNFLTETYLSLRKLENKVIAELISLRKKQLENQIVFGGTSDEELIKVSISQFYGIEINDFAVSVAKTALWIAENQMLRETEKIINQELNFLPLKTNAYIIEANALRLDWQEVVSKYELNYIMGNPPFVGYAYQSKEQKEDLALATNNAAKNLDYVAGWYYKAAEFMKSTNIRTALVSTNSITQGEQVAVIWEPLFKDYGIHIDFAHTTFRWDSEASIMAHVHCVIVGFSVAYSSKERLLFADGDVKKVKNINAYLTDAPDVFIEKRTQPICDVPPIVRGSQPTDDGNLILSEEEKDELIKSEPQAEAFIRPFMMGKDFINRKPRYCLWLVGASPAALRKCPQVLERVEKVKQFRLKSSKAATRKKADTPMLFDEVKAVNSNYVAIPVVSSEGRNYIPMDYLKPEVIAGNKLFMMENASLYHFGVLTSSVHMAWMRAVCGRLEMRYSYSNTIVYNNFPWCSPTDAQKAKIEKTAQAILDARALYPDSSLADLYDEAVMPPELRKAHQANDAAVAEAYGISRDTQEAEVVAMLMKRYQELTGEKK